ncbi:MAG: S8 family serine peptidase, partial [Micrococcales bacterium]|nr:S8 family serine peptidase [Micrococcales bacterium]
MSRRRLVAAGIALGLVALPTTLGTAPGTVSGEADLGLASLGGIGPGGVDALVTNECTDNGGGFIATRPEPLAMLQPTLAWEITKGQGVIVAVVDSGVDATNPQLRDAIYPAGVDLLPEDGLGNNGYSDVSGHGTRVAGIIAAREVEGSGVIGLAPEARILPVRVNQSNDDQALREGFGLDRDLGLARVAQGIRDAADRGATIINVSISFPADRDDLLRDAVAYATERGALVVASAGNRTTARTDDGKPAPDEPRYPAAYPQALAVTAVDIWGSPTDAAIHGPHVEVAAPGQHVATTEAGGKNCLFDTSDGQASSSWSTAYVSAAAALVAAAHRDETPEHWAYRLMATAIRPDPDHRDDLVGWGIVQPYDAIALVPGADVRGPDSPFVSTGPPAPVVGSAEPLMLSPYRSPWADAREIAAVAAIVTLAVLGILLPIQALRARRRQATIEPLPSTGGLYPD